MLSKTHLVITIFLVAFLLQYVNNKWAFIIVALIATLLPDVDARFSKFGRKKVSRIIQFFVKHRGVLHSFTFLLIATFLLVLFIPLLSLGFFVGYGSHLFADCFTRQGIKVFYPWKKKCRGRIRVGGIGETTVFVVFLIADVGFILNMVVGVF